MNKINLAILGLGRIGKVHAENIISLNECNLKIIIDPVSDFDNNFTDLGIKPVSYTHLTLPTKRIV